MKFNKLFFISLFFILLLSIFLILFFVSGKNSSKQESSQEEFSQCEGEDDESYNSCILNAKNCSSDKCRYEKYVMSLDLEKCDNINSSTYRSKCISHIKHEELFIGAVEDDNISMCEEFVEDKKITECRDNYYFVFAQNTGNKSLCSNIVQEEIRNACK